MVAARSARSRGAQKAIRPAASVDNTVAVLAVRWTGVGRWTLAEACVERTAAEDAARSLTVQKLMLAEEDVQPTAGVSAAQSQDAPKSTREEASAELMAAQDDVADATANNQLEARRDSARSTVALVYAQY